MKMSTTEILQQLLQQNNVTFQKDNYGQLVLYTGLYEWADGSINDVEELFPIDGDYERTMAVINKLRPGQ